ncbi:MAG: transcriptional repressor [Clostridia bacterium]|nr:transcriptional repressor [Clostridia bacterium]
MQKSTYNTKQKKIIYNFLLQNKDRLMTCDEIADSLKAEGTPVGKATLYRFLDSLVSLGDARKLSNEDKKCAAYQLLDKEMNCKSHLHMKCTCCGELYHLGCEFMHSVGEHILNHHQFIIDNSKTVIYGVCKNCSAKGGI